MLSEAKDLFSRRMKEKQILRFAKDDSSYGGNSTSNVARPAST
jgi:hypothetical protein